MELLKTKRLSLRSFQATDFAALAAMMSDAETMQFTGFKKPQSIERVRELLSKWEVEGANPLGVWAVVSSDANLFVGWSMLKRATSEVPELGYMIAKEYWGKGYATELAVALLEYARHKIKIAKVSAVTSPENAASIRILEKVGMKLQGRREDGGVCYQIEF